MKLRVLAAAMIFGFSSQAQSAAVDIALSNDNAKFSVSSFVGGFSEGRTTMNAGYLYNEDNDYVLDFGLHMVDVVGSKTPGLQVGVGIQGYYTDIGPHQGAALSLGGSISYRPPKLKRVNFVVNAHYAPGITSYMDAERLRELGAAIEYSLLPQADVYIGYRDIKVEEERGEFKIDDSGHIGLRITF